MSQADELLIERIRRGESAAWDELIARFEGRLVAFVESRLQRRSAAEDVVQEAFIGFLTSVPNFDPSQSLESYLFSIAAHKLTDHLRREGRRPALPLAIGGDTSQAEWDLPGSDRRPSSVLQSGERRSLEARALAEALSVQIERWRQRGDWEKMSCLELLIVRGMPNKDAAARLGISEQTVANYKSDFLAKLRNDLRRQGLPEEVFPQLG